MKTHKNNELKGLIQELKEASSKNKAPLWKRIAQDLEKPTRNKRVVNIYKLDKHSKDNDTIIVPGKVLGTGDLNHKINVAAVNFSEEAQRKISSKGKVMTIKELLKTNPDGKGIKILG